MMLINGNVVVGNTDMDYVAFGEGSKTVVVIPGLSDGLTTVKGNARILKSNYKKYLKDYTIYMFSRKNEMEEGYTIEDMADDQIEALHQLGIHSASFLGVSEGGMIVQSIAIHHPEAIEKLVLAVTSPYANELIQTNVNGWIDMIQRNDYKDLLIDTSNKTYTSQYLKKNRLLMFIYPRVIKIKDEIRFLRNAEAILNFDVRNQLDKITCPTFIIGGSDDKTLGVEASYELHQNIKQSELYIYEGLGHGAFEEAKDFYDRVFEFIG